MKHPTIWRLLSGNLSDIIGVKFKMKLSAARKSNGPSDGEIKNIFFDCQNKCNKEYGSWQKKCPLKEVCDPYFKNVLNSQGYVTYPLYY